MKIVVSEVRSRTIDVATDDFNEAKKQAMSLIKQRPLCERDSLGVQFYRSDL